MRPRDFSLRALYEALDAQRRARGLSWSQATKEINRSTERRRTLSPSTVTGTHSRAVAEGDGVLQMLLWLNRTPESFVASHPDAANSDARLPEVPAGRVLRFDTKKLHAALEAQRAERKMTWAQVGREIGLNASNLMHLAKGGRTAFPQVMRIVAWLVKPAAHFTRISDR